MITFFLVLGYDCAKTQGLDKTSNADDGYLHVQEWNSIIE